MDIRELHKLIDEWAEKQPYASNAVAGDGTAPEQPKPELPKDKRVIRTKSTGDRVYLIDETAQTKRWVKDEVVLAGLGFSQADVQTVEDSSLVGYTMDSTIFKVD